MRIKTPDLGVRREKTAIRGRNPRAVPRISGKSLRKNL
jgi:hypothetical protein